MHFVGLLKVSKRNEKLVPVVSLLKTVVAGRDTKMGQASVGHSTLSAADDVDDKGTQKMALAKNLASLIEESSDFDEKKPKSRMELKRSYEFRIKKRVKEQYVNGKFQDLMEKVIANPKTLQDSYNSIMLNSNVDITVNNNRLSFESMAEKLYNGNFDVKANTFSISTKGARKEVLVLPNLILKVVQEAIRIVLEIIYRPFFSKISHGCRSGRGHSTALRIEDPRLYDILRRMFDAQILNLEFGGFPKGHGLPQEGILAPILMNIYLDLLDREFYRLSMRYEAINPNFHVGRDGSYSKLRSWFRRQLKDSDPNHIVDSKSGPRVHACRFMDEMFFAVSGSKEIAQTFKSDIVNYLQNSLHLNVDNRTEIFPCEGRVGVCFLGTLVRRQVKESPAVKAIHKLKDKVKLFALQKREAWDAGTVRIGKKWLAHGLKKVKESEIKHLANSDSTLCQISSFRKAGMQTDHWYKFLLKVWMQDIKAKAAESEGLILSKYIAEPALPQELRESFYEFQKRVDEYVSSETAAALSLLPNSFSSAKSVTITEIVAPVSAIKKRLFRYGLITSEGHPRTNSLLILQNDSQIIDWFSGVVRRWITWYRECDNFSEIKLLISTEVRKSCIRTLAAKYRIHESEIGKRFDSELSGIPSTQEIEHEMADETSEAFTGNEALIYGFPYNGLCLLSLARMVSQSRPCNCFVFGCSEAAPCVYTLHVMERQRFPGWKTGFSSCIHPSLNKRRIGLCTQHLKDLYLGRISLQSIDFNAWK
ncbi:nuclear intron maturase 4, mitochondrial-like isoform X4 [Citrus sinensis]|uniref:nuclear intron maturase 4, mitochondrial-like isoform X4 n=1 Tax=Citrus sinensis TaxID=2711 RepID=UPI0003D74213|nr:nuclear intron maturase 4, mitochondrial-like isoform X4 [Citrus sinensis]XP_024038742.1 nuclear intron maturase 4, mitochondrial-like isoform X5 [Citrus x clementina]